MQPKLPQQSFVDTLSSQTEAGELDMIAVSNFPDKYKSSYNKAIELSKNRGAQAAIKLLELIIKRTDLDKEDETITEKEAIEITDFLNRQIKSLKNTESPFIYDLDYRKAQAMPSFISEVLFKYKEEYDKAIESVKKNIPIDSIDKLNNIILKLKDANNPNISLALNYLEKQKESLSINNEVRSMLTLEGEVIENQEDLKKMRERIEAETEDLKQSKLSRPNFLSKIFKQRTVIPADVAIKTPESPSIWNLKKLKERFTTSTDKLKALGVNMTDRYNKVPTETIVKRGVLALGGLSSLLLGLWVADTLDSSNENKSKYDAMIAAYNTSKPLGPTDIISPSKRSIPDIAIVNPDLTTEQTPSLQEDAPKAAPHLYTTKTGDGLESIFKKESKSLQDLSPAAKINAIYSLFRTKEGKDWLKAQGILKLQPNGVTDMSQFINLDKINVEVSLDIKQFDDLVTNTKAIGPDGKPMAGGQTIINRARTRYPN